MLEGTFLLHDLPIGGIVQVGEVTVGFNSYG